MNNYIEEEEYYQQKIREKALLNPRIDAVFKTMFTKPNEHSRKALKSFLEAAIGKKIKVVNLENNDASIDYDGQRGVSYDISCIFEDGSSAEIEMQSTRQKYDYGKRAEYHVARLTTSHMKKGQDWSLAPVSYQISVLNFTFDEEDNDIVSRYNMRKENGNKLSNLLNVIFIELTKLKQYNIEELNHLSDIEKWAYYLKYADDKSKKDLLESLITSEEGLMEANKVLADISTDRNLWLRQQKEDDLERDRISHENGLRREAREEGKAEEKDSIIYEMLKDGSFDVNIIAKICKVDISYVEQLKKQLKK